MHGTHCLTILLFTLFFYVSILFLLQFKMLRRASIWIIALVYLKIFDVAKSVPGGLWYFGFKTLIRQNHLFEGFYPNWEVLFNLTILKMISFAMDYFDYQEITTTKPYSDGDYPERRERQNCCYSSLEDFSFLNFCSYIFYFPLYIAGPIITFNDWNYQRKNKNQNLPYWKAIRSFLIPFIAFEIFNHLFYVRCMKEFGSFDKFTFWQTVSYSYWSLKFLWLKFLVIWRYFRVLAMINGIEAPENMLRCMSNHMSTMGFWRSWHASFNNWMIKYVYLPLGGAKHMCWNIFIIFGFAAAWHNFNLTMLCWGFLIPLFILPELLCNHLVTRYNCNKISWYWILQGIGFSINILFMIVANMIGYALDEKTVMNLLMNIWKNKNKLVLDLSLLFFVLFSVCQLMLHKRDEERIRGGKNKY